MACLFGQLYKPFSRCNQVLNQRGYPLLRALGTGSFAGYSTLGDQFQNAQHRLQTLPESPGNDIKLRLYGLFKQATSGKVDVKRPGMTNFVGRAKWDAWNALGDMTQEEAKQKYVALVDELVGFIDASSAPSPESSDKSTIQQEPGFQVSMDGKLRIIKLNKPEKKNALTLTMYLGLVQLLQDAAKDPNTSLVAITGAGNFFCSGNDLTNLTSFTGTVEEAATRGRNVLEEFVGSLINFQKPIVAVVNGPAVGIACTMLGLMDAVYASDRGWFQTPFTALGQSPEACSSLVFPRIMGTGKATEMLLFNKKITAVEACQLGFVTEIFPDATLQSEIWPRLKEISELPVKSMIYGKELTRQFDRDLLHRVNKAECDRLLERWQSEDCAEAIMKFFSRKNA